MRYKVSTEMPWPAGVHARMNGDTCLVSPELYQSIKMPRADDDGCFCRAFPDEPCVKSQPCGKVDL